MKSKLHVFFSVLFLQIGFSQNISLDPSFGNGGKAVSSYSSTSYGISSIKLQSDGKIIGLGSLPFSWDGNFYLVRYNTDGTLDTAFGNNGFVFVPITSESAGYNQLAIHADDKILVCGMKWVENNTNAGFGIIRYNSDGSIDTSFGQNGLIITDFNSNTDFPSVVKVQSDGKILVAGKTIISFSPADDIAVARYNTEGTLDTTFGNNGKAQFNPSFIEYEIESSAGISDLNIQIDGKIILVGGYYDSSGLLPSQSAVLRINSNGSLDNSYDTNGVKTLQFDNSFFSSSSSVLTNDNKLIVVGGVMTTETDAKNALFKLDENGSLDLSFGNNGKVIQTINQDSTFEGFFEIQLKNDGKLLCVGVTRSSDIFNGTITQFNQDGSLDTVFDNDGYTIFDVEYDSEFLASLQIQQDGKIICGGTVNYNSQENYLLARFDLESLSLNNIMDNKFSIYPNPFTNEITVESDNNYLSNATFELYDINGRKIQSFSSSLLSNTTLQIDNSLSKGNYLLKIISQNKSETFKVVKN